MKLKNSLLLLPAIAMISCGTEGETKKVKETKEVKLAEEVCTYSYDESGVTAAWTAYKFTEKAGVGGQFDSVVVNTVGAVDAPEKILGGLTFDIPIQSVNTKNPDRDMKIMEHFFGTLSNTDNIKGKVVGMKGDGSSGTAMVDLTMNDSTYQQEVAYTIEGSKVNLSGTIDVGNWDGNSAIAALNKVCDDLHKGEDGISKLWPTVDINITAILAKECK